MAHESLSGKVVVIAGGAGLIGRGIVKAVLEHGGTVIVADLDAKTGEAFTAELKQQCPDNPSDFIRLDITSKASIQAMIGFAAEKYKRLDAVINSAYPRNKNFGRKFEDVTYEDFCENVSMHLGGYFLLAQQAGLFFKEQGFGHLINFGSIYGVVAPRFDIYEGTGLTTTIEYAMVKSAIVRLAPYCAKYFKGSNIRFNTISPGGVYNNQPEAFVKQYKKYCLSKGMLAVEDLSEAIIFLLSDASRYVNGQNIIVDDGFSL